MGTGEAEGEKRALEATNAALLNPLIDEYSLKGAKGLLVNITGGSDLTLFEVDEAVNKIRAEVDPEAELIFGSIEDEKLNGKIRVSIVATSLDGQAPDRKPIVSMVHRLHNRNSGYSSNLSSATVLNQATLNATEGATALNLTNVVEENTNNVVQNNIVEEKKLDQDKIKDVSDSPSLENISIENATYLQNIEKNSEESTKQDDIPNFEVDSIELATPELFTQEVEKDSSDSLINQEPKIFEESNLNKKEEIKEPEMFEESNSEEDFEIPAFLRRQKN